MKKFLIIAGLLFLASCGVQVQERSYYSIDCTRVGCFQKFIYDKYDPDKRCRIHIYQGREGSRAFIQC